MRIAISGGSGFLGRALIQRLTQEGADRIVTFTRDEHRRTALQQEFGFHPGFRVYAGDVRDASRLVDILHGCEVCVHAAARKVVTGHPDEPLEHVKTNVLGTINMLEAARAAGCRKFVFISSDKAVAAINAYGKTKAIAEDLVIMANAQTHASGLRCGCVRYGNVLGSTGSVLVKWRQQHAAGQPLTVSDPHMTRFWLTRSQAVDLVLKALSNLRGGEIVVPDLPAAPIITLAEAVAGENFTCVPVTDAPTERSGHGPRQGGEKMHEELLSAAEIRRARRHNGYFVVPPNQHAEMWDAAPWLGEHIHSDTVYRSDVWPRQICAVEMRALLETA